MHKLIFFGLEEFYGVGEWKKNYLLAHFPKDQYLILFSDELLTPASAAKYADADAIGIFIHSMITEKMLDQMPKLKMIATLSTGFDHINLLSCKSRGISVSNVPSYGENTVAEHTMALILALSRKIVEGVERTRKSNFSREGLRGFDLKEKVLGVIGYGNIGKQVVKMAKAFGMNVLVYDARKDLYIAEKEGFRYVENLIGLLQHADILTVHVPYSKDTHHLINLDNVNYIKKGALLINTARGEIIQTDAILYGLKEGIFEGVGLDVLEEENALRGEQQMICDSNPWECDLKILLKDHVLLMHPKVIVTPHNAFNSTEALQRILDTSINNITAFFKGKAQNVVEIKE